MLEAVRSNSHNLSNSLQLSHLSELNSPGLNPVAPGFAESFRVSQSAAFSSLNSPDYTAKSLSPDRSLRHSIGKLLADSFDPPQSAANRLTAATDGLTGLSRRAAIVGQVHSSSMRAQQTVNDRLDSSDALNPTRGNCYKDDYLLQSATGGQYQINLSSSQFDTYLQIVDTRTGAVVAYNDDSGSDSDSRVTLNLRAGDRYIVRATSYYAFATGSYALSANQVGSPPAQFNSTYGYGLVDAAAAVARAANVSRFQDVADLGGNNWGSDLVKAPEAWAKGYTGRNVVVAVVDTGVDYTHSDLNDNIWRNAGEIAGNGVDDDQNGYVDDVRGWDFYSSDNDPMDGNAHGTHVAGTIAAENNGFGVTGVAYNAQIMPVRVLGNNGSGGFDGIARGIRYAADNGADVINLSLGGSYSAAVAAAVQYAASKGAIVVMAAGNEGASQPGYPAQQAMQWGLSVGAVDRNRTIASFSNRAGTDSRMNHVVAPGVDILSTVPGNGYRSMSGTSMATPHVAGVVALMLSANPNLTQDQVRQILTSTSV